MVNYTKTPSIVRTELNRIKTEPDNMNIPTAFSIKYLGITPYTYQHLILRKFSIGTKLKNDRTIICKSRQMGLSICLAILAIWYAFRNVANDGKGTGIHNNTKVGIISKSDDQAKKLMKEIQNLCINSDFIKPHVDKEAYLNKKEIHFTNKCWIKCYPPNNACRGESFDLLIIDEAAFVEDEPFREAMEPTVSATNGKVILSSTPNGQKGFYYELFNPMTTRYKGEYERFWFHWKMCENAVQRRLIQKKYNYALKDGTTRSFDQEYNALFTSDEVAFFQNEDIEAGIDTALLEQYEYKDTPCVLGVDYGFVNSETCLTVVTKVERKIKLIYQYSKRGLDENLLTNPNCENSIQNLCKRYNIKMIVVDQCPMGTRTNTQLKNEGYEILEFNFNADSFLGEKNRGYYLFRSALKRGDIKYPKIDDLIIQMRYIQESRTERGNIRIKAPYVTYRDDRCDSFMMACFPLLRDTNSFSSATIEFDKMMKKAKGKINTNDPRVDLEWSKYDNAKDLYGFMKGGLK